MDTKRDGLNIEIFGGDRLSSEGRFITDTTIFYCTIGSAVVTIDGAEHRFEEGTNFIVIDSAYLLFSQCSIDFTVAQIAFNNNSFNRIYTHIDTHILGQLSLSCPDAGSADDFRESNLTLEKIILLNEKEGEHRRAIMRNLILCYIYECYELLKGFEVSNRGDGSSVARSLVSRFLILCREKHTEHRDIEFYANSLAISRRYLHTVVTAKLKASPKEIIDGFILSSARRMLLTTTMSNLQIADELNFPDQSTFGQFFKRIVGVSPSAFRVNNS